MGVTATLPELSEWTLPGGIETVTPRSIVQRGTSEPTTAPAEPDSKSLLFMQ